MIYQMYLKREDAEHYAQEFADEIGGFIKDGGKVDDRCNFDYVDMDMNNVSWSGETAAFNIYEADGRLVGSYGYWDY